MKASVLIIAVLTTLATGCTVNIAPYDDRACNAEYPCPTSTGRVCVRERCVFPWDGGVHPLPDPSTTGVLGDAGLTASPGFEVKDAGAVIQNLDVQGCITVSADGVTLRNVRIRTDGRCTADPLLDARGAKNTLVEDVELDGTNHGRVYAVMGADLVLRRIHLHHAWSAIRLSGDHVALEHSLVHELTGDNAGAFVASGGQDFRLLHNDLQVRQGDCVVTLYSQQSAIRDVLAEANLFNGGGWTISAGGGGPMFRTSNVRFLNNRFGRKFNEKCGGFGPVTSYEPGNGNAWSNNTWDDTGEPILP